MSREETGQREKTSKDGLPARAVVLGGAGNMLGPAVVHSLHTLGCEPVAVDDPGIEGWNTDTWCRRLEELEPEVIVDTLHYPGPDQAEQEPSRAYYWHKEFPCLLARAARSLGIGLVYFSSDCVFDGMKQVPYTVADAPNPLSVYGKSFLAGERALQECGLSELLIVRCSWLFGPYGPNFVDWVLNRAQEHRVLHVVHDQIGSPTYSFDLAACAMQLMKNKVTGVHHVCNKGQASWCELAAETLATCGLNCQVQAVTSGDESYRPPFSVLDPKQSMALAGRAPRSWPQALREYIFTFQYEHIHNQTQD